MFKKLLFPFFALAVLFGIPSLGNAEECKIYNADVFFGIVSAEKETVQIDMQIRFCQYGPEENYDMSVDSASDRALSNVFTAYSKEGKKISSATLRLKEGEALLKEKTWIALKAFNVSPHESVIVVETKISNMTFSPDPESVGQPTMFFMDEESGDAKAGI